LSIGAGGSIGTDEVRLAKLLETEVTAVDRADLRILAACSAAKKGRMMICVHRSPGPKYLEQSNKRVLAASVLLASLAISCVSNRSNNMGKPAFSFDEIQDVPGENLGSPDYFKSTDGVRLAFYSLKPRKAPVASLVFLHGGGAYSDTGYRSLALGLAKDYGISVYLLDLRGHGHSEGARGDAPSVRQVWRDIKAFVGFVKGKERVPLFLGGHSSGGGLIVNYASWYSDPNIEGFIFISPELGYKSGTDRRSGPSGSLDEPFARASILPFVVRSMSFGLLCGHASAVFFNYPDAVRKNKPLLLKYITCNMSLSMTPSNPKRQFKGLDKPFFLFIGENDEVLDPIKVANYAELPNEKIRDGSTLEIVGGEKHLSILLAADRLIGESITKRLAGK
jgi:acylglycerol lipase